MLKKKDTQKIFKPFKKDKIENIISDFKKTGLYKDEFLNDLENGLKDSSMYSNASNITAKE